MSATTDKSQKLISDLEAKLQAQILEVGTDLGDVVVRIDRSLMLDFFQILKLDTDLAFNMLLDVTVVDWLDSRDDRYQVVYHFLSLSNNNRIRVTVDVPETDAKVSSVKHLWSGADFLEREAWDMYGVEFDGHGDLRRIMMYDEFEGHPLRKDYPVQGKQPRIKLRAPEVENTARQMVRDPLVRIGTAKG